jgi:hypothetical protein
LFGTQNPGHILQLFGEKMDLFGKKEEEKKESTSEESSDSTEGKYQEACSLCGKAPTDKKWGGQFFHRKCYRKLKKGARGMI